jgi:hypothetical protein
MNECGIDPAAPTLHFAHSTLWNVWWFDLQCRQERFPSLQVHSLRPSRQSNAILD